MSASRPVQRIQLLALILLGLAVVGAWLIGGDARVILGVLLGGVLASVNFFALSRIILALSKGGRPRRLAWLGGLLSVKFGLLGLLLYVIIRYLPVNPIAFLVGVSVVVLAIFIEGFRLREWSSNERA